MFNPYAAGNKVYGGGRPMPTVGPVDLLGYRERDAKKKKRSPQQNAAARKLQAMKQGNYASADYKRGPVV